MKRQLPLLLAIIMLSCLSAAAQKMVVREWQVLSSDPTASLKETERYDSDGRRAALIRIYTPFKLSDLGFGGSGLGFVDRVQTRPGEILLYVPQNSQKLTISHPQYPPIDFWYLDPIESGRTYAMVLTAEGKSATLKASVDDTVIVMDGDTLGKSPVSRYIPYGYHEVRARNGSMLYDGPIIVSPDGEDVFQLKMEDENQFFGDVVIDVPGAAELWFRGELKGIGRFTEHLREGDYIIETRKKDHSNATTPFTVVPGKSVHIDANPPVPHIGYLSLTTEPYTGVNILQADTIFTTERQLQLPVDTYELTFTRRGYEPETRKYQIVRAQTLTDTVRLRRTQYVKQSTLYAAAGFEYATKPGIGFTLGGMWRGIDLSASYQIGFGESKEVNWFEENIYDQTVKYKVHEWAIRAGYQLRFAERFGLTPQVGFMQQRLIANDKGAGNGFTVANVTVGARLCYYPVKHFGFYLRPEYAVPVNGNKGQIDEVCKIAGITKGGFRIGVGLTVYL